MATLLLSAAGAAIGGTMSGTVLGLSGAVIGRAVGATLGRVIDQKLLGTGSEPVETGKIDRYRLSGVGEGTAVASVHGRMRIGGQVIWSTHFRETSTTTGGGGKGAPPQPKTTTYSYSVSLALALCEGEILRIGRIWADGTLVERDQLNLRVYKGTEDQLPDPKMEAVEGVGQVPAYRGMAYVVIEDLDLSPYGNRVPQFSFEVIRAAASPIEMLPSQGQATRGVALIPGTGEYALATTQVTFRRDLGGTRAINRNTPLGATDFAVSLEALREELPNCGAISLVVSWFGDDLRAGQCSVRPKVEQKLEDGAEMPWSVSGLSRSAAQELAQIDGRPVYGGTPADASVIEAIQAIRNGGQEVLLYPFLLMDILAANGLPDPWSDSPDQPVLPWRGRITGDIAPGRDGSPDKSAANGAAVDAFFGTVRAGDFSVGAGTVGYSGPQEWTYSRFILHMAALCAAAGGVEAFCVGSELRGITQMRDDAGFPAIGHLRQLAAEVRSLLPGAKISYAADWSEYFGYQPQDGSGDVLYHLDPLWADENIDFIGIDNYMPLSDWRDGGAHRDAAWQSVYNPDYLKSNIEGGEGYDWYYPSQEAREAQIRAPITDGSGGKPWVFRYKDIRNWWSNLHFDRQHPKDRSILAEGAVPSAWLLQGGATTVAAPDSFDQYASGIVISSGGAVGDAVTAPASTAVVADQTYELRAHLRVGTAGGYIVRVTAGAATVTLTGTGISAPATSAIGASVQSADTESGAGGVVTLRCILRFNADAQATVQFGPNSDVTGADVTFYGVDLGLWPVPPSPWVPMSKPVWFTEFGCPAVDKGTNQPNVFVDPKSSESALPHYSTGRRDDVIQAQHLRALMDYWSDPEINPVSPLYDGPMIDTSHAFAWAWDARPYPAFPSLSEIWSDGENYTYGHWLNGRSSSQPLDHVVAEICGAAGLTQIDVSALYGNVRGHAVADVDTARAQLQPLMLAYDFTAVETDGAVSFRHLPLIPDARIRADQVLADDEAVQIKHVRAPEAETVGRVRISHNLADGSFETSVAEAIFPDDRDISTSQSELPLSLTANEARDIAERWLATARLARDTLEVSVPPSRRDIGAGRLIALEDGTTWRIDRLEDQGARVFEASRVEPTMTTYSDASEISGPVDVFRPPLPVDPLFMDLPLLTGEEAPHAPHIAVAAMPWPGPVAVYASPSDGNFALNTIVDSPSVIGVLESPLAAVPSGQWDRGPAVRVRIPGAALSSVDPDELLNGANVAALGGGDTGPWEVIQFARAELVAPDLWDLSLRLRGQAGTDGIMPAEWPAGTYFVLLDGRQRQIDLAASARGLARHYRIGPARRSPDDGSFSARTLAFDGIGLRPYAPAHLRAISDGSGKNFTWIRRTRIDGDSWQGTEVPLGEDVESYLVRVFDNGGLKREETVDQASWSYAELTRLSDGTSVPYSVDIAQISARFGPGPFTRIDIDG